MATSDERRTVANRYDSPEVWREVDTYFNDALLTEDEALKVARESSVDTTLPHAEVAPNQAAFLALLVQTAGARRVLEFGTLAGYSTIWLARAVGTSGHVVTLEKSSQNATIARRNFERADVSDQIDLQLGTATELAEQLIANQVEPFDFVFIDADKPNNPNYLAAALKLTKPGSLIVIDNVVRNGAVINAESGDDRVEGVRTVTEDVANNPELEAVALQTVGVKGWDGVIIARRR